MRFYPVPNKAKLEKKLDQIYIGNLKLHVNFPKYRRAEVEVHKGKPSTSRHVISRARSPKGKMKEKEVWRGYRTIRKDETQKPKQSYVEVARKHSKGRRTGPAFETPPNAPSWLVSSAVGWMSSDMSFDTLNEEFVNGGMSRIKLRFMGDNLVLLTPKDGDRMEDIIKLNNEWFVSLFYDIAPCVRCYVIPLTLWNK